MRFRWHVAVAAGHKSGRPGFKRCHPRPVLDPAPFPLAVRMWRVQRHPEGTRPRLHRGRSRATRRAKRGGDGACPRPSPGRNIPVSIFSSSSEGGLTLIEHYPGWFRDVPRDGQEKAPQVLPAPRGRVRHQPNSSKDQADAYAINLIRRFSVLQQEKPECNRLKQHVQLRQPAGSG